MSKKSIIIFLISIIALVAALYHVYLVFHPYTPFYRYKISILDLTQVIRATAVFFILFVGYLNDFIKEFGVVRYGRLRKTISYVAEALIIWFTLILIQSIITRRSEDPWQTPVILIITMLILSTTPLLPQRFNKIAVYSNIIIALLNILPWIYLVVYYEDLIYRGTNPLNMDLAMGWIITLSLLTYVLRHIGPEMPLLVMLFIFYDVYGYMFPGLWRHPGFSPDFLIGKIYIETEAALWGVITNVAVKYIVYFFLLAGLFSTLGFGEFMAKTFLSLLGNKPVNVGRVAVGMGIGMGMISGSGAADTAFISATLKDLFRKAGYDDLTAAGLCANAGTLAIITPPILGSVAFIMVELLHIPYIWVMIMAAPLAVLYALSILFYNEFLMRRIRASISLDILREKYYKFHVFLPAIFILIMVLLGYSIQLSVALAMIFTIVLATLDKDMRRNLRKIHEGFIRGYLDFTSIGASIVAANVIMSMVVVSGLHLKFSLTVLNLVQHNLALAIMFATAFSILLGMGVPPTATFVLSSVLVAPVIEQLAIGTGIPETAARLATYMFLFYMAMLADVTPPVALSAYAAGGIFGTNPITTGVKAALVALPKYIYAPAMVYSYLGTGLIILPVILTSSSLSDALTIIVSRYIEVLLGIFFISSAVGGYLFRRYNIVERIVLTFAGIALIIPGVYSDIIGLLIGSPVVAINYFKMRKDVNKNKI
jgi:TRAP transporter 4TM/12TM fusion protein